MNNDYSIARSSNVGIVRSSFQSFLTSSSATVLIVGTNKFIRRRLQGQGGEENGDGSNGGPGSCKAFKKLRREISDRILEFRFLVSSLNR